MPDYERRDDTPEPTPEPAEEPVDDHRRIPLDDDEDGRWLQRDDPRRLAAEERRGKRFDSDEEEIGYEGRR
jgi:hypothetical protein